MAAYLFIITYSLVSKYLEETIAWFYSDRIFFL